MTGPEHYLEAERLLGIAGDDHEAQVEKFAEAQVHATLALATSDVVAEAREVRFSRVNAQL